MSHVWIVEALYNDGWWPCEFRWYWTRREAMGAVMTMFNKKLKYRVVKYERRER